MRKTARSLLSFVRSGQIQIDRLNENFLCELVFCNACIFRQGSGEICGLKL